MCGCTLQLLIKQQYPNGPHNEEDEMLVILSEFPLRQHRPVIGVRGEMDWTHTIKNLRPSTRYKIQLLLKAEVVNSIP